jgi:hypothetical protein
MKIEKQVLSIEQVRELQELGFDVSKYASMCYTTYINKSKSHEEICYLTIFRGNFMRELFMRGLFIKLIPTLTTGDIIEILPLYIKDKKNNNYWREINYNGIIYYRPEKVNWLFTTYYEKPNKPLIEALFETLKWCIKEKYINLK